MERAAGPEGWAKLFKIAFKRSANPMLLLNKDRTVIAPNAAFMAESGYSREELVGHPARTFISPEEQARSVKQWERLLQSGHLSYERAWVRRDGSRLEVEVAAVVVEIDGRQVVLAVVLEHTPDHVGRPPEHGNSKSGPITPRERQVLTRIALGDRLPEVAKALHISPSTARTHVRNLMEKLDAHSQAQLVAVALCEGLLDLSHLDPEAMIESK